LIVLVAVGAYAAEDDGMTLWNQCGETVIPACRAYVATFVTEKEAKAWSKRTDDCIQQKMTDGGLSEDSAIQSIGLDWATDNRGKLEKRDREAIKRACLLFLRFWDRKIPPPGQMRERMTLKNSKELADFLNDEVQTKKMSTGAPEMPKTKDEAVSEK
jgi:hypothetical protein